ncbi:hypothetical protein HK101_007238, partial [Irineochytrium annulatum]
NPTPDEVHGLASNSPYVTDLTLTGQASPFSPDDLLNLLPSWPNLTSVCFGYYSDINDQVIIFLAECAFAAI